MSDEHENDDIDETDKNSLDSYKLMPITISQKIELSRWASANTHGLSRQLSVCDHLSNSARKEIKSSFCKPEIRHPTEGSKRWKELRRSVFLSQVEAKNSPVKRNSRFAEKHLTTFSTVGSTISKQWKYRITKLH
jgi:hypothetical protein